MIPPFVLMVKRFETLERKEVSKFHDPRNAIREIEAWGRKFARLVEAYKALDDRENIDGSFSPRENGEAELQVAMAWKEVMNEDW